jgi:multiple sugar transport system ATP-binding protein|tara:strand:- start:326 stop:514 length:189 start_codon:yes stop_codon:yes gene_type:complete
VYSEDTVGHRLLLMNERLVEQIGTPLEVSEKPKVHFIAGFICSPSMKFIPVRLDQSGNQIIL